MPEPNVMKGQTYQRSPPGAAGQRGAAGRSLSWFAVQFKTDLAEVRPGPGKL